MTSEATNDDVITAIYDLIEAIEQLGDDVCEAVQEVANTIITYS